MVNTLQIIIHIPLIAVQIPGNASMIYDVMIPVATFDILPTEDNFPKIFPMLPLEDEEAYTENFERLSYGSNFVIMNLGTMFVVFTFYLALYMLYPILYVLGKWFKRPLRWRKKLDEMLYWNHLIVFL